MASNEPKVSAIIEGKVDKKSFDNAKKAIKSLVKGFSSMAENVATTTAKIVSTVAALDELTKETDKLYTSQRLLSGTFGDSTEKIQKYGNKLTEIAGLTKSTVYDEMALFGQTATSLGMANDVAVNFAENISTLSAKMSMLYNTDFESMSNALRSVAKGATKQFTSLTGIVLKEAQLQEALYNVGINRTVSSLNSAEKAMVQYIAIANQMVNADNQISSAAASVAYQKQMLKNQVKEVAAAFGNLLYPILQKILPILNATLIVIKNILGFFGRLIGVGEKTVKTTNNISAGFSGIADSASGAAKAVNKSLRSFDKLNNIQTPDESGSGALSGLGGGISSDILDVYDSLSQTLDNIHNKAEEIADSIMKWLGFTKNVNGEWEFTKVTFGTIVGLLVGAGGIYWGVKKVLDILGKFGLIKKTSTLTDLLGAGGLLGKVKGIADAVGTFLSTPVGTAVGIATALVGVSVALEKIQETSGAIDTAKEKLQIWGNATGETKQHLKAFDDAVKDLQSTVDYFSYSGLEMTDTEYQSVLDKLVSLSTTFNTELDNWYSEQKAALDELYDWEGAKDSEHYKEKLEALNNSYKNATEEYEKYQDEYKTKWAEFYKNDKKISSDERLELLKIQEKMQTLSIDSFTKNEKERQLLAESFKENTLARENAMALDSLSIAKENHNKKIEAAKQYYKENEKQAREQYGKDTKEYQTYMAELTKATEKMKKDASKEYTEFYDGWKNQNTSLSQFVDKNTGQISQGYINLFGTTEKTVVKLSEYMKGQTDKTTTAMIDEVKKKGGEVLDTMTKGNIAMNIADSGTTTGEKYGKNLIDAAQKKINNSNFKLNVNTSSLNGGMCTITASVHANGGFPEDGLFFANHNELVGKFSNGKTAVANNDQITKGIEEASFQGMMKALMASGGSKQKIEISAEGDASGLLDFITFKQKQADRRNGL